VKSHKTIIKRDSIFNKSSFFENYIDKCYITIDNEPTLPKNNRIITSDDVFDYILNIRTLNEGIDLERKNLFSEYNSFNGLNFKLKSLADYEQFKKIYEINHTSMSKFVKKRLKDNVRGHSNGESAFKYFVGNIDKNGIYLLDEPENSLSPKLQIELANFIEDHARFFGCQFIISTHSPFFLSLRGAKIYDLDEDPVIEKRWTELENVRAYHDFFKLHEVAFSQPNHIYHDTCLNDLHNDPMETSRIHKMYKF
jgi:predicted ATP-dependent endonuclease of OLD family